MRGPPLSRNTCAPSILSFSARHAFRSGDLSSGGHRSAEDTRCPALNYLVETKRLTIRNSSRTNLHPGSFLPLTLPSFLHSFNYIYRFCHCGICDRERAPSRVATVSLYSGVLRVRSRRITRARSRRGNSVLAFDRLKRNEGIELHYSLEVRLAPEQGDSSTIHAPRHVSAREGVTRRYALDLNAILRGSHIVTYIYLQNRYDMITSPSCSYRSTSHFFVFIIFNLTR